MENRSTLNPQRILSLEDRNGIEDTAIRDYAEDGIASMEKHVNSTAGRFEARLMQRYHLEGAAYSEEDSKRYSQHTGEIIDKLGNSDQAFASMDDAARGVFGKGIAAALYSNNSIETKTAALRDVIAMYRDSYTPTSEEVSEEIESEHEADMPKARTKLGRFAAMLAQFNSFTAVASTKVYIGTIAGAQKAFSLYRKPLDAMEVKSTDSRLKKIGKRMGKAAYYLSVATGVSGTLLMSKNVAEAANITVNGHGSGSSNTFNDVVANSSVGKGQKNTPAHVSNEMGDGVLKFLFPEDNLDTRASGIEGAERIEETMGSNPKGNTLVAYSQGTMASVEYLRANPDYLANGNHVILVGGPYTPGRRLGDNPLYKLVSPLVPETTKVLEYESPKGESVLYIVNEDDPVWLKGNNPVGIISDIVNKDAHAYSSADLSGTTPHVTVHNADGSTTRIITETKTKLPGTNQNARSGISAALINNNHNVSNKADKFFEAADGDPVTGKWNMQEVATTGAAVADEALPGSGQMIDRVMKAPGVTEAAQQVADAYMNTQNSVLNKVTDAVQNNFQTPQTAQPAPAWVPPAQPVQQFIEQPAVQNFLQQSAPAVDQAVKSFVPPAQQAQVNGLLKGIGFGK